MSSQHDDVKLPGAAEAILADWPLRERDDSEWDELAQRTVELALERAGEPVDDALFEPPLPATAEEAGNGSRGGPGDEEQSAGHEEAPPGLAQIARAAVDTRASEERRLAQETLSAAAQARRDVPQSIARAVRPEPAEPEHAPEEDEALTVRSESVPAEPKRTEEPRAKIVELPPQAHGPTQRAVLAIVGALAVAAAAVLLFRSSGAPEPTAMTMESTAPGRSAARAPAEPKGGDEPEERAAAEPEAPKGLLALDDLPLEGEAEDDDEAKAPARGAGDRRTAQPSGVGRPAAKPESEHRITLEETPTQSAEPGEPGPEMKPAAQATDVPQRPSVGAVQAAVASVMTGAQMCLAGQKDASKATITFGSDGEVDAVSVAGPAAGTGAEGCIQAALKRAKVSPFAEPAFSARVTVRPP